MKTSINKPLIMTEKPLQNTEPNTTHYQIVSSMTADELLSEGYANYDDFYDPDEEEWKIEVEKMRQIVRENKIPDSECTLF